MMIDKSGRLKYNRDSYGTSSDKSRTLVSCFCLEITGRLPGILRPVSAGYESDSFGRMDDGTHSFECWPSQVSDDFGFDLPCFGSSLFCWCLLFI